MVLIISRFDNNVLLCFRILIQDKFDFRTSLDYFEQVFRTSYAKIYAWQ